MKIALDFGTTNTLLAQRKPDGSIAILPLEGLTDPMARTIPSLLYVNEDATTIAGHAARSQPASDRLFRDFKRGILSQNPPPPVLLGNDRWDAQKIGSEFLRTVFRALPQDIQTLAMSVPVTAFQAYIDWLTTALGDLAPDNLHVVDESTAAALGYAVTEPGALVLVFDFGGGTLDLSLVRLPDSRDKTGGLLNRLWRGGGRGQSAQVVAKAGRALGGSDIDHWLAEWVAQQHLVSNSPALLMECERAKIRLSDVETTDIPTEDGPFPLTRADMETLLAKRGFYLQLRRVVDKLMHAARQRGIFMEDIKHVLMVGGMSLMPSVQTFLQDYYTEGRVHTDKPFTAVAEGALVLAEGGGLDDYLIHSYGLRYVADGVHRYDEILPMGTPIPTPKPVDVLLQAAHPDQAELEIVVGRIDADHTASIDVRHENGHNVLVAQDASQSIIPLNGDAPLVVPLDPRGAVGSDRVAAAFRVDESRQLLVTLTDVQKRKVLARDVVLATIR